MVIASSVSLIEAMIRISLPQDLDGIHRVIGDDAASVGDASTDVVGGEIMVVIQDRLPVLSLRPKPTTDPQRLAPFTRTQSRRTISCSPSGPFARSRTS